MILDGYSEHRTVRERDGEVSLSYRPLLWHERMYWREVLPVQGEQRLFSVLRRQIEWWDRGEVSVEAMQAARSGSPVLFERVWRTVFGVGQRDRERDDADALMESAKLIVRFPHLWSTDVCAYCRKWWYDPIDNQTVKDTGGNRVLRGDMTLLCETREGCPRRSWESPVVLPERHVAAYRHWRECKAAGFPDDGIVRRNARIFEQAWKISGKKS